MKIGAVRHIDGPNIYLYKPIMIAKIDLEDLTEKESYEIPGFPDRLLACLPGLKEHHCAKGRPGGFVERLQDGTYFGHIVEHVAIELASIIGLDVHYGKTLYDGAPGKYEIVMECHAFAGQRHLLHQALALVQSVVDQQVFDLAGTLAHARAVLANTSLGPSTQAIVSAARSRGIPVRRLTDRSLIQLGYGSKRRLVQATITDGTSTVAVDIAGDKALTKDMLKSVGIPVPEGDVAETAEEAVEKYRSIGAPIALKPYNGNQGRGVSLNLSSEEEVVSAYERAAAYSPRVIVERYVEGRNVRIIVIGGKYVAASERTPAHVIGDGKHSVAQLVDAKNESPMRGDDHEKPLTKIPLDESAMLMLARQGTHLDAIPAQGQLVLLRDSANLSTGGEATDVTAQLHMSYRGLAERAARIVGLDICGIDMVVPSLTEPADTNRCAIVEINAAPGIRMHQHPSQGIARDVGGVIVDMMFPHDDGRIPIVSVTGTNGKTTTTRLIAHGLKGLGKTVGMTTTSGIWIGDEQVLKGDTTGPMSARTVLSDPAVEAAVLETARGGIVRGGLAYDRANVAVITNITLDHIGQDFVETVDDLLHIKSLVAECVHPDGTVVLNADDPSLLRLSRRLQTAVAFFTTDPALEHFQRHLATGGVGYWLEDGWLMEGRGSLRWPLVSVQSIPLTDGGTAGFQIENCLAAAAAMRALGLARSNVQQALSTFLPAKENLGRGTIFEMPNGARVVLDYGHNPDGFRRMGEWLRTVPHHKLIGVVGVPGDRADRLIGLSSKGVAAVFDHLIVKEDEDKRGRATGEVARQMADAIAQVAPDKPCATVLSETDALQAAYAASVHGDVIVVFYERLDPLLRWVQSAGGQAVHGLSQPAVGQYAAIR